MYICLEEVVLGIIGRARAVALLFWSHRARCEQWWLVPSVSMSQLILWTFVCASLPRHTVRHRSARHEKPEFSMGSDDSDRWALQFPFFGSGRIAETLNLHDDEFEFEVCVVPSPDVIRKVSQRPVQSNSATISS